MEHRPRSGVDLYQTLVSPAVTLADLQSGAAYNKFNRWNTTDGIVHYIQDINTLECSSWFGARLRHRPTAVPRQLRGTARFRHGTHGRRSQSGVRRAHAGPKGPLRHVQGSGRTLHLRVERQRLHQAGWHAGRELLADRARLARHGPAARVRGSRRPPASSSATSESAAIRSSTAVRSPNTSRFQRAGPPESRHSGDRPMRTKQLTPLKNAGQIIEEIDLTRDPRHAGGRRRRSPTSGSSRSSR